MSDPAQPTPDPKHGITESPEELRQRNLHEKEQHQDAHAAAMGAAAGLGCIALPLIPWIAGFLAFAAILIIGLLFRSHHPVH